MTESQIKQAANATIAYAYGEAANAPNPMEATLQVLQKALELHKADMEAERSAVA